MKNWPTIHSDNSNGLPNIPILECQALLTNYEIALVVTQHKIKWGWYTLNPSSLKTITFGFQIIHPLVFPYFQLTLPKLDNQIWLENWGKFLDRGSLA